MDKFISAIDAKIKELLDSDETLSNQHKLLCSIDGIGSISAAKLIVATNAFKDFENARQFCCYIGVAPFEYTSGSSVHSKKKVSQRADKSMKSVMHVAAVTSATRMKDGDMREYYLRKIAEGKNKMSVLNAIRGKIILRIFAVIKNNRPYEKNYQHNVR